jgi:hypothetical protein
VAAKNPISDSAARLRQRILRPQAEALAEIGQDRRVLGDRLAAVEAQRRHAPQRMDLEIGFRALLALGEVDALGFVFSPPSSSTMCAASEQAPGE